MASRSREDTSVRHRLHNRIRSGGGRIPLMEALHVCLYEPGIGYYVRNRPRVGMSSETDFYTASSLGPVFAQLVLAAVESLLPEPVNRYTLVELGPESGDGIVSHLKQIPFRAACTFRPGDPIRLSGKCVCFSNEVFDAQPFRRFRFENGTWKEAVVTAAPDDAFQIRFHDPVATLPDLPSSPSEGYQVDWPEGAHRLLHDLCRQPWEGLFLTLDYGLPRQTLLRERPHGTARTYHRHVSSLDLFADPGNEDITCHLAWDEMERILSLNGFEGRSLQSQESFFIHHARKAVEAIVTSAGPGFAPRKQTLMELLHPGNMGHAFQALHAIRMESR